MSTTRAVPIALLWLIVCGCVLTGSKPVPGKTFAPTQSANVEVFFELPTRSFDVIGFIDASRSIAGSDERSLRKFKEAAAKLGADGIIVEAMPKTPFVGLVVQGRAKAIKWK
jgi:hypothetical protein